MAEASRNNDEQKQTDQKQSVGGENIDQIKGVSAVAYILFFVPLLTNRDSEFATFHANQGLVLLVTSIVINIVGILLPVIGWFFILPLGWLFILILAILGIVNALNGEKKPLPLVGGITLIK